MTDKLPKKVIAAPGLMESLSPEDQETLREVIASMQADLDLGVMPGQTTGSMRAIRFVDIRNARCCVCRGVLAKRDPDFDDEYICDATMPCKAYLYMDKDSEEARAIMERHNALELSDEGELIADSFSLNLKEQR